MLKSSPVLIGHSSSCALHRTEFFRSLLEADEIVVKPFEIGRLTELVNQKMLNRKPTKRLDKERVGVILQRCVNSIVEDWLTRAKRSSELNCLLRSDEERTGHLPKLVEDLAVRLSKSSATSKDSDAAFSAAAAAHGELRYQQGPHSRNARA